MADDLTKKVGQDEIEELLKAAQAKKPAPAAAPSSPASAEPAPIAADAGAKVGQDDIDSLLKQRKPAAAQTPAAATTPGPTKSAAAAVDEDPNKKLGQGDIEALLSQRRPAAAAVAPPPPTPARAPTPIAAAADLGLQPGDLELLLAQAEQALASIDAPHDDLPPGAASFRLPELAGAPPSADAATLELVRDVELDLKIELGRTHMHLHDVLRLRKGSVVTLDKLAGDPVDIYVNGRLIARGEVLVLNDNFCVRVAELVTGELLAAG